MTIYKRAAPNLEHTAPPTGRMGPPSTRGKPRPMVPCYLRNKRDAEAAAAHANHIHLWAERKLGKLSGVADWSRRKSSTVELSKTQIHRFRRIYSIPKPRFEEALRDGAEATTGMTRRFATGGSRLTTPRGSAGRAAQRRRR